MHVINGHSPLLPPSYILLTISIPDMYRTPRHVINGVVRFSSVSNKKNSEPSSFRMSSSLGEGGTGAPVGAAMDWTSRALGEGKDERGWGEGRRRKERRVKWKIKGSGEGKEQREESGQGHGKKKNYPPPLATP
jgi:hypothetical protein